MEIDEDLEDANNVTLIYTRDSRSKSPHGTSDTWVYSKIKQEKKII